MKLSHFLSAVVAVGALSATALCQNQPVGGPMFQQGPTKADISRLASMKHEYEASKADYAKHPKNERAKQRFIKAATIYGHESMISPVLTPRVKYPQALRIYGEVLKLDPNNKVAKPESDLIIRIYKQMGRPVPKH